MTEEIKAPTEEAEVVENKATEEAGPVEGAKPEAPNPNQQLTIEEIMRAAQMAQAEAEKFTVISNTLLKCGLVVQSILSQNAKQAEGPTGGVSENPPAK